VLHVQEPPGAAAVHDFVERVGLRRVEARVEGNILRREVVRVGGAVAARLILDVWRRRRRRGVLLVVVGGEVGGGIECGGGA